MVMDLQTFLTNCQKAIGYQFRNTDLLRRGLTHSSGADTPFDSNERMEFLGDAVLGYVICTELFTSFPNLLEGDMTKIKSSVVSRTTCQKVASEIGLNHFLILGRGLCQANQIPHSILANAMESLIAAIYLDGGFEQAKKFILRHFQKEIEKMLDDHDADNFKSILQQYAQKNHGNSPEYKLLEVTGPDHRKTFNIGVR
ncbi:MAG: ribonuclease III, partial [Thermoguttaceae bacterium]